MRMLGGKTLFDLLDSNLKVDVLDLDGKPVDRPSL